MKYSQFGKPASLLLLAFLTATSFASGWTYQTLDSTGYSRTSATTISGGKAYGFGVVGFTNVVHALCWDTGTGQRISLHPSGASQSFIYGASGGVTAGQVSTPTQSPHATIWNTLTNTATDLNPPGYSVSRLSATDGAQHVGEVEQPSSSIRHAGLWNSSTSTFVDLHPVGYFSSVAFGVSNGTQAGFATDSSGYMHAGVWEGSSAAWRILPLQTGVHGRARSIDGDLVGGEVLIPGGMSQASLWSLSSNSQTILHPTGFNQSQVMGNQKEFQIGWADSSAAFWQSSSSSFENLGTFTPIGSESYASGIEVGQSQVTVAGWYALNGTGSAVIWTKAVPEPGTLLAVALGGVFLRRKKK